MVSAGLDQGKKPADIAREIKAWAHREGRNDHPVERSVYRIAERVAKWPEHERKASGLLHWPRSFELGLLPWDAARTVLDLWRNWDETGRGRPTVRVARWYWRLMLADPTLDRALAELLASVLSANDVASLTGAQPIIDVRSIEQRLAYQPGKGAAELAAHAAAQHRSPYTVAWQVPGDEVLVALVRSGRGEAAAAAATSVLADQGAAAELRKLISREDENDGEAKG
jgi:hypothetical protein